MLKYVIRENVLSDNLLLLAEKDNEIKGGYIALIKEYAYYNAWEDRLARVIRFRKKERLFAFLDKNYPEFDCDIDII